ncbi:MAG TPA: hypothetical protein VIC85_09320 [Ktedonobacterales bacterium]
MSAGAERSVERSRKGGSGDIGTGRHSVPNPTFQPVEPDRQPDRERLFAHHRYPDYH